MLASFPYSASPRCIRNDDAARRQSQATARERRRNTRAAICPTDPLCGAACRDAIQATRPVTRVAWRGSSRTGGNASRKRSETRPGKRFKAIEHAVQKHGYEARPQRHVPRTRCKSPFRERVRGARFKSTSQEQVPGTRSRNTFQEHVPGARPKKTRHVNAVRNAVGTHPPESTSRETESSALSRVRHATRPSGRRALSLWRPSTSLLDDAVAALSGGGGRVGPCPRLRFVRFFQGRRRSLRAAVESARSLTARRRRRSSGPPHRRPGPQ